MKIFIVADNCSCLTLGCSTVCLRQRDPRAIGLGLLRRLDWKTGLTAADDVAGADAAPVRSVGSEEPSSPYQRGGKSCAQPGGVVTGMKTDESHGDRQSMELVAGGGETSSCWSARDRRTDSRLARPGSSCWHHGSRAMPLLPTDWGWTHIKCGKASGRMQAEQITQGLAQPRRRNYVHGPRENIRKELLTPYGAKDVVSPSSLPPPNIAL